MVKDPMTSAVVRHDIRNLEKDEHKIAKEILIDNKVLNPNSKTALYDQFTGTVKSADDFKSEPMGDASNINR